MMERGENAPRELEREQSRERKRKGEKERGGRGKRREVIGGQEEKGEGA